LALDPSRVRSSEVLGSAYPDYVTLGRWLRNCLARFSQRLDVKLNGVANQLENLTASSAGRHTARKVWDVSAVTGHTFFNNNEIFHNSFL
jgi:hypothetical protein